MIDNNDNGPRIRIHPETAEYNPESGQFTSPDPILGGNETRYAYPCDPVNFSDGSGEWGLPHIPNPISKIKWGAIALLLKGAQKAIGVAAKGCSKLENPMYVTGCAMLAGGFIGGIGYVLKNHGIKSTKGLIAAVVTGAGAGLWATYGRYVARVLYSTKLGSVLRSAISKFSLGKKILTAVEDWMTKEGYK